MHKKLIVATFGCTLASLILITSPAGTLGETDTSQQVQEEALEPLTEEMTTEEAQSVVDSVATETTDNTEAAPPADVSDPEEGTEEKDTGDVAEGTTEDTESSDTTDETTEQPDTTADQTQSSGKESQPVVNPETGATDNSQVDLSNIEISSIHSGTSTYKEDLENHYYLNISDDFPEVMQEIEKEYREKKNIVVTDELTGEKMDDTEVLATNWQDIIAVYLLKESQAGETEFTLDKTCKKDLYKIFTRMNSLVPEEDTSGSRILYQRMSDQAVQYEGQHIADLIAVDQSRAVPYYSEGDVEFLETYASADCQLLCAISTQAQEFLRQSVGDVSSARQSVVSSALSLVGRVSYFWGGKSNAIGWDDKWGKAAIITAAGSKKSGTVQEYGLDCSGYVSWAFLNGAHNSGTDIAGVGGGTTEQWNASEAISQEEALPGDIVLLNIPSSDMSSNHVGIVVGVSSGGGLIVAHCNASDDTVTLEEASAVGFRYVRRPKCLIAYDQN